MGLCWEEPSPDRGNTSAGRPWAATVAGDRGQPRATSRAGEPEQDLVPLVPRLLLIHPTALFAFFNDGKNSLAGSKAHLHLAHLQLRPKWCHLINREVLTNQRGFKTLTRANNSKICHRFQESLPAFMPRVLHLQVLENNNKIPKIWDRRIKTHWKME